MVPRLESWRAFHANHRATIFWLVGVPLALAFLGIHLLAMFLQGYVGTNLVDIVRTHMLLSLVLAPLLVLVVPRLRTSLPPRTRDRAFWAFGAMFVLVFAVRLLNVDGPRWSAAVVFVLAIATASSVGVIDMFRFRSWRLLVVAAALFVVLAIDMPPLGVQLARGCLDDYRNEVLAEVAELGGDSELNYTNARDGRCGPIAWASTRYDDATHNVVLPAAGGALEGDGLVWGDQIRSCRDTEIYLCESLRDLGGGWFAYTRVATAN